MCCVAGVVPVGKSAHTVNRGASAGTNCAWKALASLRGCRSTTWNALRRNNDQTAYALVALVSASCPSRWWKRTNTTFGFTLARPFTLLIVSRGACCCLLLYSALRMLVC